MTAGFDLVGLPPACAARLAGGSLWVGNSTGLGAKGINADRIKAGALVRSPGSTGGRVAAIRKREKVAHGSPTPKHKANQSHSISYCKEGIEELADHDGYFRSILAR